MSAAGGAHLALVPPSAAPEPPPSGAPARSSATKSRRAVRVRQATFAMWAGGCALLVAAPFTGDLSLLGMGVGAVVLLGSGLTLIGFALVDQTREAVRALVAAPVMLAAAMGLVGPARHAAIELHVVAHQQELDALAAEIRAGFAATPPPPGWVTFFEAGRFGNFGGQFRRLGISQVAPADGGLLFEMSAGMGYTLLYADGLRGPADPCGKSRLRFIGGRWYERRCLVYVYD